MPRAAPSREAPSATNDLEAGVVLKLGEYAEEPTLNTSEARMIILKTLDTRAQSGGNIDEVETLVKTNDYLEIFAVFKELQEATQVEGIINVYGSRLEKFEKSQIGV
jgi:DNA-directed RNA polymerase II subunit RPB4